MVKRQIRKTAQIFQHIVAKQLQAESI